MVQGEVLDNVFVDVVAEVRLVTQQERGSCGKTNNDIHATGFFDDIRDGGYFSNKHDMLPNK